MSDWRLRHEAATLLPSDQEKPIMVALWLIELLAEQHGDDYVLRVGVVDMIKGARVLLNWDWGPRLDMGTLDRRLGAAAERIGYDLDVEEFRK